MTEAVLAKSFLISDLALSFDAEDCEFFHMASAKMKRMGLRSDMLHFQIYKKSIDARKKDNIKAICSVLAVSDEPIRVDAARAASLSVRPFEEKMPSISFGDQKMIGRPLVVGMGPCGLFSALMLAENGYRPILIDRGGDMDDRVEKVETFYKERRLDSSTNIQFGAGGAGTFSDGKLVTRIHDEMCGYVLRTFHQFGAPDDILTKAKPHIGTDILRGVVSRILERIKELGGTLMYRCQLQDITYGSDGGVVAKTSCGDIDCGLVILAIGHSARDTYAMLGERGFRLLPKPFSVGVRVEHLQSDVDACLFGRYAGHPKLGKGEYNLSYTGGERGVYTFCMCPGGEVMAAASEEGGVVVNGMSRYARDGKNANSAVAVSILPSDCGNDVFRAIEFQRELERRAFMHGGQNYAAPIQTMGDFLNDTLVHEPGRIQPTYMNGHVKLTRLGDVLPTPVSENLKRGFAVFSKKMACFGDADAILSGVETRTSAPLRVEREQNMCAVGKDLIYPCGEGAGYAGGITSAAVDGVRTALAVMSRFARA
jgi:uncharacterized FAD-dependent dehydrogenase